TQVRWPLGRSRLTRTNPPPILDQEEKLDTFVWPQLGDDSYFAFTATCWDKNGREHPLRLPLMWVAEHYEPGTTLDAAYDPDAKREVAANGAKIAFTPRGPAGDSVTETHVLRLRGRARRGESTPYLSSADVVLDSARRLANLGSVRIVYNDAY